MKTVKKIASDLSPGDVLRLSKDSLLVLSVESRGQRVRVRARSAADAGGCVERSYLAGALFDVDVEKQEAK